METTIVEPRTNKRLGRNGANNDDGIPTLEDVPLHLRNDPLTKLWLTAIDEAVQRGEPFLTLDEINQEVARRRGGCSQMEITNINSYNNDAATHEEDDDGPLTLEDIPLHLRGNPIVKLALAAREEALANGEPLLTLEEINREVARRRGGIG